MRTDVAAGRYLETGFFERADDMWEQLGRALATDGQNDPATLTHVQSATAYDFLMATADRVFSHDLALAFLKRLREWGKEKLDTRHASTPQVHIYHARLHRDLAPDGVRTQWHYLYSLTRGGAASVRFAGDNGVRKQRFGVSFGRITTFQLTFNQLLAHETCQAYALQGPKRALNPLDGAIVLHGYLW